MQFVQHLCRHTQRRQYILSSICVISDIDGDAEVRKRRKEIRESNLQDSSVFRFLNKKALYC